MATHVDHLLMIVYFCILSAFFFKKSRFDSILDFSLNKRAFSSWSLFFTIIATMIGGTGFVKKLNLFYADGWLFLIGVLGVVIQMLLICLFILPKSHKILGHVSVSSFMNEYYGDKVRVITAITSSIGVSGFIASQCKIIGVTGHIFYPEISEQIFYVTILIITAIYCYNGGIRSVVITDIIQSICFTITFCVLLYYLWPSNDQIIFTNNHHDLSRFSFFTAFDNITYDQIKSTITLFLYCAIPMLTASQFQRISMARNDSQLYKAWWGSAFFMIIATIIPCYIGYYTFFKNPDLKLGGVYSYLLSVLEFPGLKAIAIIGVVSMAMSTADSHMNVAAVNLANDTYGRNTWDNMKKIKFARGYIFALAILAYLLIITGKNFLQIVLFASSFYMPLITAPLFTAIRGYKLTERCVLISIAITFFVCVIMHLLNTFDIMTMDPLLPCLILNILLLAISHYIIEKWEWFKCFGVHSQLHNLNS